MLKRRLLSALLVAVLLTALPAGALAAKGKKASIKFPAKVCLMQEGDRKAMKPKLKGVALSRLTWSSSDESVLSMFGNEAQGMKAGKAVLTAAGGGAKARCGVVVLPASVSLTEGQKVSLPRGGVEKYRVGNKAVASVSKRGVIAGKRAGQTKVLAYYGRQKVTIDVIVTAGTPQAGSAAARLDCAAQAEQIVLVDYTGGSGATLSVHEKKAGVWTQLFECPAYVGKNGIGKTVEGEDP